MLSVCKIIAKSTKVVSNILCTYIFVIMFLSYKCFPIFVIFTLKKQLLCLNSVYPASEATTNKHFVKLLRRKICRFALCDICWFHGLKIFLGKGGKNRRRGKNENETEKRELVFKEDGQEYAQVTKMLGNGRLEAMCFDGVKRLCHIRGKLRKKVWFQLKLK